MSTVVGDSTNRLIERVQRIVPEQPWGPHGTNPVPVQVYFDAVYGTHGAWQVKYVCGLTANGTKRRWDVVTGDTLEQALQRALSRCGVVA